MGIASAGFGSVSMATVSGFMDSCSSLAFVLASAQTYQEVDLLFVFQLILQLLLYLCLSFQRLLEVYKACIGRMLLL